MHNRYNRNKAKALSERGKRMVNQLPEREKGTEGTAFRQHPFRPFPGSSAGKNLPPTRGSGQRNAASKIYLIDSVNRKKKMMTNEMKPSTPSPLQVIVRQRREIESLRSEASACHRQIKKLIRWQERLLACIAEINMPPGSQDPLAHTRLLKAMKPLQ